MVDQTQQSLPSDEVQESSANSAEEKVHWANIEERGVYLGLKIMLLAFQVFGRWLFTLILYPVITYFFFSGTVARRSSLEFLQNSYRWNPEKSPFKKMPGRWQVFLHLISFGNASLDKIASWLGKIPHHEVDFPKREEFLDLTEKSGGVILASHLGNMELLRAMGHGRHNVKLTILVHTHHAELFNRILREANPEVTTELTQVTHIGPDTAMLLKEKVDRGEYVVIVGDRISVDSPGRNVIADFLGKPAAFPQGPFILASLLRCPVYLLFCVKEKKGYYVSYEVFAEERLVLPRKTRQESLQKVVETYVDRLAEFACRYPLQWYNFFPFWQIPDSEQTANPEGVEKESK